MARYIDADALKPDYVVASTSTNTECYRYVSLEQIMNAPTADVVEVVRCEDCKYGHRLTDANGYNYRICNYSWGHGMMVDECGFCKWGKRRE